MNPVIPIIPLLQAAGVVQLAIVAANVVLPRKLSASEQLARLSPILRQVFIVHWVFIVLVVIIFAVLSVFFAPDLAGMSLLGTVLSVCLAAFWLLRVAIQVFVYDAEIRRQHPLGNFLMTAACAFLAAVFTLAALGALR